MDVQTHKLHFDRSFVELRSLRPELLPRRRFGHVLWDYNSLKAVSDSDLLLLLILRAYRRGARVLELRVGCGLGASVNIV